MNLDEGKIDQLIKSPRHRPELEASLTHHRRLSFHCDLVLRREHASRYYSEFSSFIGQLLPADKADRVRDLLAFPLATNELTKDIFIALQRVWYAKDFIERFTFISDEYETDFTQYLKSMKIKHLWRVEGWSALKTAIDSVMIIDLPEMQLTPRPEPYFYFIHPEDIIDMEVDECNDMQYIIFTQTTDGVKELIVYDDTSMRKYSFKDGKRGNLIVEVQHDLGYCPARMFWSDKLQNGNFINKRSPITDSLGDLDWLLFFKTSKKYLDLHSAYPVYITYEIEQEDESEDKPTYWEGQAKEKKHKGKGLMGPGSFMTVPPPLVGQPDMMTNPIQVVGAEIPACEYSVNEVERLELDIYESCVGKGGEMSKDQAVNEKQVSASFKSREEMLMYVAGNYKEIMTWTYETLARLRYGDMFFSEALVDFGEDFFLETSEQLMTSYSDAKQKGISPLILDTMNEKINDVAYKHQSKARERADVYKYLDPLPELSVMDLKDMAGLLDATDVRIKINLLKYIRQFELEYGDVVDFMPNNFAGKIAFINQKFNDYAVQQEPGV